MRQVLRSALYHARKYELGCPTEDQCQMYAADGPKACQGCPKHLTPEESMPPPVSGRRIAFLTKVESMIAVGCKFQPDDLTPRTWQELVWLRIERDRMDGIIRDAKDKGPTALPPDMAKRQQEVRAIDKLPAPGQPLFARKR